MITSVSYSRLAIFESCEFRAKLAFIDRIPEPERPLPEGKTEHANDRGTRIHTLAEKFVESGKDFPAELKHFEPEFRSAHRLFKKGTVTLEGEWGFTVDWKPADWKKAVIRVKTDLHFHLTSKRSLITDTKTGKRFGNEFKHTEQTQLYAVSTFHRYPKIEECLTELWYTDVNEIWRGSYSREHGMRLAMKFNKRFDRMLSATKFRAMPSIQTCKYCPYKPKAKGGTGHCSVGV
jgi:hypothetical protein